MNPYIITEPTCISFSGGRTSAYMLYRVLEANNGLPDDCIVCFCNTGKEHSATLEFVDRVSKEWNVKIHWLEYRSEKPKFAVVDFETASRNGEPFEQLIREKGMLPNNFMRFCTQDLKVNLVRKYLKHIGMDVDDRSHLVGIRADEPRRIAKVGADMCPLARDGITEHHVKEFWEWNSFDLNLPKVGVNKLSNCDLCFMKGDATLAAIIQYQPWRADWWIKMEDEQKVVCVERGKSPELASFRRGSVSYQQMKKFNVDQISLFSDQSIACFCGD